MTIPFPLALTTVKFTAAGSGVKFGRNVLSFKPDQARAMERARTSVVDDDVGLSCSLTDAQYKAMDRFYKVTTRQGTLPFSMIDPDTDAVRTFQFADAPQFGYLGNSFRSCSISLLRFGT